MSEQEQALRDALEALLDEQNGAPLIRREAQWQAACDQARAALAAPSASTQQEPVAWRYRFKFQDGEGAGPWFHGPDRPNSDHYLLEPLYAAPQQAPSADALPRSVCDLLAVLNGDGGHYRAEHGTDAACKRALQRYDAAPAPAALDHLRTIYEQSITEPTGSVAHALAGIAELGIVPEPRTPHGDEAQGRRGGEGHGRVAHPAEGAEGG